MKKPVEKDKSERWLLTYSDLMNLLLILFIILYSMSKTDVAKATAVAESIRKGFNASSSISQTAQSPVSDKTTSTAIDSADDYSKFYDELISLVKQAGMQNQVDISEDTNDVIITLKDTALYPSGSADLSPQAKSMMSSIGGLLLKVNFAYVMIEGYTDTDPIHTAQFQDNRDLSTERANNVCRVLIASGIPQDKLASIGWGETHPVAKNDTSENKALNRRVVLTITKSNVLTPQQIVEAKDLLSQMSATDKASMSSSSASSTASSSSSSASSKSSSKSSSKTSSKASSSKTSSKSSSAKASS